MEAQLVPLGKRRLLLASPRDHALGLLVADVLIALQLARARQAKLLLLPRAGSRTSPLLHLRCDGVQVVPYRGWRRVTGRLLWWVVTAPGRVRRAVWGTRNSALEFLQDRWYRTARFLWRSDPFVGMVRRIVGARLQPCGGKPGGLREVRDWMKRVTNAVLERLEDLKRTRWEERQIYQGHDVRRAAALQPLGTRLAAEHERRALALAEQVGLSDRNRIVTLHVRAGSSKAVRGIDDRPRDAGRNARIESYFPAIDFLVSAGFTVVRIGDPTMVPVACRGVIDLASSPLRDPTLELWCVARSAFFIAGDSGPYLLSWLFNVPSLAVNIVNVLGVYPLRRSDLYIVKRLREVSSGRMVPLSEMLEPDFILDVRRRWLQEGSLEYVDNTADDILEAVLEMVDGLKGGAPEAPSQQEYRDLLDRLLSADPIQRKVALKSGLARGYLGEGRIARAFADRYLHGCHPFSTRAPRDLPAR